MLFAKQILIVGRESSCLMCAIRLFTDETEIIYFITLGTSIYDLIWSERMFSNEPVVVIADPIAVTAFESHSFHKVFALVYPNGAFLFFIHHAIASSSSAE